MIRVYLAGRMGDYETASRWRQMARMALTDNGIDSVSPVFGPWEGSTPPALTPEAVEWPDLRDLATCQYILVAGGAGSGTGFGLGYAFARKEQGQSGPRQLLWVSDAGPPPPFIRLWEPRCFDSVEAAVAWLVQEVANGLGGP